MDVIGVLRTLLGERGWSQVELAERLGTSQATISRWLAGDREPRGKSMEAIRSLAIEAGLVHEMPKEQYGVPIMGYVGAGNEIEPEYEQVPPEGLDQVELPFPVPDGLIGFQVRGDSMLPKYNDGDVIVVPADPQRSTASLMYDEAAVRTLDGHRFLKRIMPGPRPDTFNLESFNARTIVGAQIAWASAVWAIVPAGRLRRSTQKARKPRPR